MTALFLQQVHQGLVYLTGQHHLHDVHRFLVGDPQTVDKYGLFAVFLHHFVDFGTTAVDQHHLDTDEPQQGDIFHHLLFEFLVNHSVAAVFHHDDFADVLFNIGQSLGQHQGSLSVGKMVVVHTVHSLFRYGSHR